jgi:hypothetical protein
MNPELSGCVICGYAVHCLGPAMDPRFRVAMEPWLGEFRASRVSQICDNDLALIPISLFEP